MNFLEDIKSLIDGDPAAARVQFGLKKNPDAKWIKGQEPGITAAQSIFDNAKDSPKLEVEDALGLRSVEAAPSIECDPLIIASLRQRLSLPGTATLAELINGVLQAKWSKSVVQTVPLCGDMNPWVHWAHMAMVRKYPWMGYHQETNTVIQMARNRAAKAFLSSGAEWCWMVDGDTIPPFGDPGFFYSRLGVPEKKIPPHFLQWHAIDRLRSHKKTIVSAIYHQRRRHGAKVVAPIDSATSDRIKNGGPSDRLLEVPWVPTGCVMVHRKVFEDIMEKFQDELAQSDPNEPFNFFGHDIGKCGEDMAFFTRAKEAGHASFLDLGVWCAHMGNHAFIPEDF